MANNGELNTDILQMFDKKPLTFPIYQEAENIILQAFPDTRIKVSKTQVSYYNKHLYAALWPPMRKIKKVEGTYIVLTFGIGYKVEDERIIESVEPYPNRWTHHVLIFDPAGMDEKIMNWLREAYDFSMNK
ncbi:DUF5655 domain-containing protein [Tyzzerella sp. OttesenSCG-928-J15]|nr:DUF5655 domain-containing protein [Tyzzerella sp. OttesenSCG-928-J15]